ncbi:hypothetical protein SAMN05661012_05635 [Chitinophaga sancti]|uniref:Uncharacterized protein n=1 Tax=Chitinophaga sancti TaxID=1004 RepID=A0A1K1SKV7_9BACT|nr:hypothetical protein SAMN05661012_05635 [Chitinophaga sancti]
MSNKTPAVIVAFLLTLIVANLFGEGKQFYMDSVLSGRKAF